MFTKKLFFTVALTVALIAFSCSENESSTNGCGGDPFGEEPYGGIMNTSGCKDFSSDSETETPQNQECVKATYFAEYEILQVTHINGGFNCCPGKISAAVDIEDRTITISEKQAQAVCDCECLYDINYELRNIVPGVYEFIVTGPYTGNESLPALEGVIDIAEGPGEICVEREQYPWR